MPTSPHVCLVSLSGFRIREPEMLSLGMSLPGLQSRAEAVGALPALGLLTLAALTPQPWSLSYHEAPRITSELITTILSHRPTLVAISALTASILEAYTLADTLRAEGIKVAIGGLHATALPHEAATHADAVVIGDGEPVWQSLLADAHANSMRPHYRADAPFNLADAPLPRLDLLGARSRPRFTLQTSRGCPFACDFCGASRLLGSFREKPVANINAELRAIKSLDRHPTIELADDNTFAGRRDASALLSTLASHDVRFFTEGDWRIGERPDVLSKLADAGCAQLLVGIESLIHQHRGMGAKQAPLSRVIHAVNTIQSAGVPVIGCFIVGSDGETHESIAALADFLVDAPFADIQLTLLTPFPGTQLHQRLAREGRLLPDRTWSSYTLFDATFRPDHLSTDELESSFRNLVRMTFSAGPTARRAAIRREAWSRRYGASA